jgi:hypothetical protein
MNFVPKNFSQSEIKSERVMRVWQRQSKASPVIPVSVMEVLTVARVIVKI